MFDVQQTLSHYVNRDLGLFEGNIANQRFVNAVCWFHIHENDFSGNCPKALNLYMNRTINLTRNDRLCCGL